METNRRIRLDLATDAESAIDKAIQEVEKMPASEKLTRAVILLSQARKEVSDFVDNVD